jgi:hypothetical protein
MSRSTMTFDTGRSIGLTLPCVEEGTAYGAPALKAKGRMFACVTIHRSAEPGSLVVRIPFEERNRLLAADPGTYYLTDHYADYPVVLVRLARSRPDALRKLLRAGLVFVTAGASLGPRRRTNARRR